MLLVTLVFRVTLVCFLLPWCVSCYPDVFLSPWCVSCYLGVFLVTLACFCYPDVCIVTLVCFLLPLCVSCYTDVFIATLMCLLLPWGVSCYTGVSCYPGVFLVTLMCVLGTIQVLLNATGERGCQLFRKKVLHTIQKNYGTYVVSGPNQFDDFRNYF